VQSGLTQEQEAYREALRGWLAGTAPPEAVRKWLDDGDAAPFESQFAAGGWAGVGVPEDLGGEGGGLPELAVTAGELARTAAPSAAWLATVLAVPALASHPGLITAALGGEAAAWLIPAEVMPDAAPGLTPGAGGQLSGLVPRVLAGDRATRLVVPARTGSGPELRLVDARGPGVRVTPRHLLDRSRSAADIVLDGAPSELLSADATAVLREAAARAALLVAADSLGATERMLEMTVTYSQQRHQFGVPIGSFQAVKHAAATILVGVEAARSIVYFAAASAQAGDPQSLLHAAAAKAQVTADGAAAADSALTLHGAIGYTWEHDLQLYYKRAKLDEQLYGPPAAWYDRIADSLDLLPGPRAG
jgi:alkylation response protein AidB-like acyl-CoA dehydrogenase